MRILSVSDLHYRLPHYDWLVKAAADADVVVLAGDLADVVSPVPHDVQAVVLTSYLSRLAEQALVLVSSGNHDLDGPGDNGEQVAGWLRRVDDDRVRVDGTTTDVDGIRFTVCPWWDGELTRAEVDAQLAAAAVDRPERWVWIYHSPPAGTVLCRDGRREFPDHELAAWIEKYQPDVVICGHIHQAPWAKGGSWHARLGRTQVFNAGKQIGHVPPHITFDTAGRHGALVRRLRQRDHRPALSPAAGQCPAWSPCPSSPSGSRAEPVRGRGAWWCTRVSRMRSIIAMWSSLPANWRLTSTRYWVSPSSRAAVIWSTPSAAPGRSRKKVSGSSITCTVTSVVARAVAVAVLSRIHDISPKTAPPWVIRANGVPSRSTVTVPDTRTSIRDGGAPSAMSTSPAASCSSGRSAHSSSISVTRPIMGRGRR